MRDNRPGRELSRFMAASEVGSACIRFGGAVACLAWGSVVMSGVGRVRLMSSVGTAAAVRGQ